MKYVILKWNKEQLKYEIVHYTHDWHDLQKGIAKWPESEGYIHMIELNSIKYHDFQEMCRRIKDARLSQNNS